MRLSVKVNGRPGIIVGYAPGAKGSLGPLAIVLIAGCDHPMSIPLIECKLPRLPKRLARKIRKWAKAETQDVIAQIDHPN